MANSGQHLADLSTIHKSTGKLFQPHLMDDWKQYRLTDEQVAQYWDQGYLSNVRVLTEEQCEFLRREYERFMCHREDLGLLHEHKLKLGGSGSDAGVVMHASGHWRESPAFHDLVFLPSIVVPVSQLLYEARRHVPVRFLSDQLFAKPARHGKFLAWHQDFLQWPATTPINHITVQVALDDQCKENGALAYVPGSHRWRNGVPIELRDFKNQEMDALKALLEEEERQAWREELALLKSGECTFHHPLSVHCSRGNTTDRVRRSAVLHYLADGVKSDTDLVLLPNTDCRIPPGQEIRGQFFPLVFQPPRTTSAVA